jgi:hypothetical protein
MLIKLTRTALFFAEMAKIIQPLPLKKKRLDKSVTGHCIQGSKIKALDGKVSCEPHQTFSSQNILLNKKQSVNVVYHYCFKEP